MFDFRIVPPINLSSGTARGREMLGNLAEAAADLSCNPMGRVSGALFPFRADVIETETTCEVFAELAGFTKDQITVSYDEEKYLHIKAERPEPEYEVKYLCHERRMGAIERSFAITGINDDGVKVSFENGVLHVVLPKAPESINSKTFNID